MKRILLFAALVATLSGCDASSGLNGIHKTFPNAEIKNIPNSRYEYVIKCDDGAIWYAYHDGSEYKTNLLFRAPSAIKAERQ